MAFPYELFIALWCLSERLEQPVPYGELEDEWVGVDPTPARVTQRFTLILAVVWFLAGVAHATGAAAGWDVAVVIDCQNGTCVGPGRTPIVWPHARPRPRRPRGRRLRNQRAVWPAAWPEPRGLFQAGF